MTREDEIRSAASDHRDWVCCGFIDFVADARSDSFSEGAEWADKHPRKGLISIDKVEKYLREHIILYARATTLDQQKEWFDNFRKVMEE